MPYTHRSIQVNSQPVHLADVAAGKVSPHSEWESALYNFLGTWLREEKLITLYTSGTTGIPKPIVLTRDRMQQHALRTIKQLHLDSSFTALVCLSTKYIAGIMMVVRALEGNMKLIAVEPSSDPFETLPQGEGIHFMAVAPLQLQHLLRSRREQLNACRTILVGSAPLSNPMISSIQDILCPVYETYGMTETISHVALRLLNTYDRSPHFSGLEGVKFSLDARGCLVIKDPILESSVTTNDLVDLLDEHTFHWLGRIDHVINSGGIKISPEKVEREVEKIFRNQNKVVSFFVGPTPHPELGQQVSLFLENDQSINAAELREQLAGILTVYEVPRQVITLPGFIYTATGKINRSETLALLEKERLQN